MSSGFENFSTLRLLHHPSLRKTHRLLPRHHIVDEHVNVLVSQALDERLAALREAGAGSAIVLVSETAVSQDLVSALEALRHAGFSVAVAR